MKKKSIGRLSILLVIAATMLSACKNQQLDASDTEAPLDSGLVGLLKPVNERIVSTISTIKPESGTKIFSVQVQGNITYDSRDQTSIASRVDGRIERLLIHYNYQPVKKGQLIMEIYSPDLAAAQRELLFIYQTDKNDTMLQKAKQRLLLLGMQEKQIKRVLNTGKILYRIPVYSNASGYIFEKSISESSSVGNPSMQASLSSSMGVGGNTILLREGQYIQAGQSLFSIYNNKKLVAELALDPSLAAQIKKGKKLTFHTLSDTQTVYTGTIGLIKPTFKTGGKFTLARVYLQDSRFKMGQLITATIPIVSKGWWVPKAAVHHLGNRSILFKKDQDVFLPREVKTKITTNGMVLIEEDIGDWEIASNAAFLVDSEGFIQAASGNQTKN